MQSAFSVCRISGLILLLKWDITQQNDAHYSRAHNEHAFNILASIVHIKRTFYCLSITFMTSISGKPRWLPTFQLCHFKVVWWRSD